LPVFARRGAAICKIERAIRGAGQLHSPSFDKARLMLYFQWMTIV